MRPNLRKRFLQEFPQNFIIKHPLYGGFLNSLFTVLFILVYNPLGFNPSRFMGYVATMIVYSIIFGISVWGWINILNLIPSFSPKSRWTFGKELVAILLLLFGNGIVIYFAGFIIEVPTGRWNFYSFFDSVKSAYLVGIIPFMFFTLMNIRYLIQPESFSVEFSKKNDAITEKPIQINSQLKRETLSFHPDQLIYAVSEGNYVNFYLQNDGKVQKKIIRNSISDIENQLTPFPYLFRTHRAFIVNLKKVSSVRGNSLGYRLKMFGIEEEIPVSRTNTSRFSELCKTFV